MSWPKKSFQYEIDAIYTHLNENDILASIPEWFWNCKTCAHSNSKAKKKNVYFQIICVLIIAYNSLRKWRVKHISNSIVNWISFTDTHTHTRVEVLNLFSFIHMGGHICPFWNVYYFMSELALSDVSSSLSFSHTLSVSNLVYIKATVGCAAALNYCQVKDI